MVDVKITQLDLEKHDGVIHMISMNSCSGAVESTCFMVKPAPITDLKIHFLLTLKTHLRCGFLKKVEIWTIVSTGGLGDCPKRFKI